MFSRYKLIFQYDGTNFSGWQLQKNKRTVQGVIENALIRILNSNIRIPIYGSGRTDTGVHAWGQVVHVDLKINLNSRNLINAINANLPKDVELLNLTKVENGFHSRFDATKRLYVYQCFTGKSLLHRNQCWKTIDLNVLKLNSLASEILGEHDFLSFSKFNKLKLNTNCKIFFSEWKKKDSIVYYKIVGNRFLHHMVRYLVGSMVAVNDKKLTKSDFLKLIRKPKKEVKIFKAPPQGLILKKVFYD